MDELLGLNPIGRVVDPVIDGHVRDGERVDAFQATNVEPVLLWIGPALMVSVDAAAAAEEMPGGVRVELVELEMFFPPHDANARQGDGSHYSTLSAADGTVTAAGVFNTVREIELQFHGPAMAGCPMLGLHADASDFFKQRRALS